MTNLRKIAMAVAIIAVFTTFVGCGKTQQEAVEVTTEQVADDTQEQAVADDTQEQAVADDTQEQAVADDTQEQAVADDTQEVVVTVVYPDGIELTVKWCANTYFRVYTQSGVEAEINQVPETPPNGGVSGKVQSSEMGDWLFYLDSIYNMERKRAE